MLWHKIARGANFQNLLLFKMLKIFKYLPVGILSFQKLKLVFYKWFRIYSKSEKPWKVAFTKCIYLSKFNIDPRFLIKIAKINWHVCIFKFNYFLLGCLVSLISKTGQSGMIDLHLLTIFRKKINWNLIEKWVFSLFSTIFH
jgi:hypothetical protein